MDRLVDAGLDADARIAKTALLEHALTALGAAAARARVWWVPGRVELLGKHTDYAGGHSLLCAVERGCVVASAERSDDRVSVHDVARGERWDAVLHRDMTAERGRWSNYPATVCRRLSRNFPGTQRGVDIAFASDLPADAGLSSSSMLVVATYLAVAAANRIEERAEYAEAIHVVEDLAGYLGCVENGAAFRSLDGDAGVGTSGGSEDHVAILCARPRHVVQYAFAPIRKERDLPFPSGHTLLIASSGVVAAKTGAARAPYNRAAARARELEAIAQDALRSPRATLAVLVQQRDDAVAVIRAAIQRVHPRRDASRSLIERLDQFVGEQALVNAVGDALAVADLERVGALIDRSQRDAERLLGNQIDETAFLARSARTLGAVAASAFGAGFGGSVYALVRHADAQAFGARWRAEYVRAFPGRAAAMHAFISGAGPPVTLLRD